MRCKIFLLASTMVVGTGFAGQAYAQVSTDTADEAVRTTDAGDSQEIVITARKRIERLQDAPVAASVVSTDRLSSDNVTDISDLNKLVPSVNLNGTLNGRVPLGVRGISSISNQAAVGIASGVAILIDGVPVPSDSFAGNQLEDVARIEVLKGPQATLGGRTAAAGVINIVTRAPTNYWTGGVNAVLTTDNQQHLQGFVSGPISTGIEFSLAGWGNHVVYPITNTATGKKTNQKTAGVRGKLRFRPTDDLDITLAGRYSDTESKGSNFVYTYITPGATLLGTGRLGIDALLPNIRLDGNNQVYNSPVPDTGGRNRDADISLDASYQFGDLVLSSTTAFQHERQASIQDLFTVSQYFFDVITGGTLHFDNRQVLHKDIQQTSQEFKLVTPADRPVSLLLGAFYSDTQVRQQQLRNWVATAGLSTDILSTTRTYDIYGRLTWKPAPSTTVIGGLRYNHDVLKLDYNQIFNNNVPGPPFTGRFHPAPMTDTSSALVGDVTIQQRLGADVMAYLTYARGYAPPAYNSSATLFSNAALKPVGRENIDHFELGLKGQFFRRRLTTNFALFNTQYDNFQIQTYLNTPGSVNPPLLLSNAGGARTRGVEFDGSWAASDTLRLTLAAAYIDAKFSAYRNAPCWGTGSDPNAGDHQLASQGCVFPAGGSPFQDATGKPLPNSPKFKFNVGAEQRVPLDATAFDVVLGGNYTYRSSAQMQADQNPHTVLAAYGLLNLSAGLVHRDGKYSVTFFVNNVFDKHYVTDVQDFWNGAWAGSTPRGASAVVAQPGRDASRYAGLRLNVSF